MRIVFVLIFLFSLATQADKEGYYYKEHLSVPKGTEVHVLEYSQNFGGVFKGYTVGFDGEGDYFFRVEQLAKAMNSKPRTVIKNARKIAGKKITLKNELKTVLAPPSLMQPIITE